MRTTKFSEVQIIKLLKEAEKRGCVTVEGMEMLKGQIEPIATFFGM